MIVAVLHGFIRIEGTVGLADKLVIDPNIAHGGSEYREGILHTVGNGEFRYTRHPIAWLGIK